jgi:superfamily II DNA or RNA helicase
MLRDYDMPTYYELETMLIEHGECCLVGTTGVGKTRISMGFVKNYNLNTLVISDRKSINRSWEKQANESGVYTISTITMQNFHKAYKMFINGFDLYIFDEAHHLGGNEWFTTYKKFKKLISEECFIIGLTATSKRYFDKDGINDITESIFNGHAVYAMSRREAINLGIIGEASYVYAIYDTTEFVKKYLNKEMTDELRGKLDWAVKNQPQVSEILYRYAPDGNKKGIVYVDRIKSIDDAVQLIGMTFPKEPIWYAHSKMRSSEIKRIIEEFEKCKSGFIVNVDMISEGIHYNNINMIIMLRRTISPNKLVQQAGRASNSNNAVIFDLVGNRVSIKKALTRIGNSTKRKKPANDNKKESNHPVFESVIVADHASDFLKVLDEIIEYGKHTPWSSKEDETLKKYYPHEGPNVYKRIPGRTKDACSGRAAKLKIYNVDYRLDWTSEEDNTLREYYPEEGKDVSKRLPGRSPRACISRANKLKIIRSNKWSKQEDDILKEYYPYEGPNVYKRLPRRNAKLCMSRANRLGIRYMKYVKWSDQEDEILIRYYEEEGEDVSKYLPGRTKDACAIRARKLGLICNNRWTREEDKILRKYYSDEGGAISERLPGRNAADCRARASKLGLKRNK